MADAKVLKTIFQAEVEIPKEYSFNIPLVQEEYLVNGELRRWQGPMQEVLSPVCVHTASGLKQKNIGRYPLLTEKEAMEVLGAAVKAYDNGRGLWPTLSVEKRIQHVEQFAIRMKEKRREVVNLLMWEIGKSLADSEKEFDRTVNYIQDTIYALKDLDRVSSRFTIEQGVIGQIRRAPLGVVLCMGPYNYPLNETFATLIPALIMGNTVVIKPPKHGVLLHQPLLEAFRSSFPKGVVNTVYGEGQAVIGPMMASGKVNVLAFIGSAKVANILKKQHPKLNQLRCVLGLEAKNAGVVLEDADLETTVNECVLGALSYNGQRCTALKILFVHVKIWDAFIAQFVAAVDSLCFGLPWSEKVSITPLPDIKMVEHQAALVEDAKKLGAKVINRSGGVSDGTFFYPAVVCPVNEKMRLYREEQFGPVVPILPFEDIEMPVQYIMNSNYGQQVSVFGSNADKIADLIDPLVNQVCRVNINSQCQRGPDSFPFTGRKDSAEGTLSVSDALRVFSIRTLVAAKGTDGNKKILSDIVRDRKSSFLSTDFIF